MSFLPIDISLSPAEQGIGCLALLALGLFVFVLIQPYLRRIGK